MYRLGVDILEVSRMERALGRRARFMDKIFTEYEKNHIKNKSGTRTAGGLFCAKESVSKLLGKGISGFGWKDIEIKHSKEGKPIVELYNGAKILAEEMRLVDIEISISHCDSIIIAVAIGRAGYADANHLDSRFKIPKRKENSHKGDYGKVAVIGGSRGMLGAPYMSSRASLRTGSGLVYTLVPSSMAEIMQIKSVENIVVPVDDDERGFFSKELDSELLGRLEKMDAVALGPGMGRKKETEEFIHSILDKLDRPMLIDADGIAHLKSYKENLKNGKRKIIITPHLAEFANLLEIDIESLKKSMEKHVIETARKYGITVVLKGNKTIVSDGSEVYINNTGNPGMATAGSGDVLTGIILSFWGQGFELFESAKLGVYVHGLSGDRAAKSKGEYGMIASDIIESLPETLREIVDR